MSRAFFFAVGLYVLFLGVECLCVQKFILRARPPAANPPAATAPAANSSARVTITPAPWTPWSLMSTGAVVCLYSFTMSEKPAGK
ncbi:MAG: hypothetical protein NZ899_13370 [Thermoguttaceae bacterium]|nr:hypothetical protein [Thermoguttaceae bacterium]MDW8077812.1 hypothetical protein [Thermoguttaceae bacterium]